MRLLTMNLKLDGTGVYRNTLSRLAGKKHLAPNKSLCTTTKGQTVVSERRGSVVTIAINRPEVRNAVNQETARQLLGELQNFEHEPTLNVAVLCGLGGNFCAGYDLKELANHTASLKLEQDVTKGPGPMGPFRLQFSKPLIAAVTGYAVAGGLELALLADLRVLEESAIMGVFCRRFVPASVTEGFSTLLPCLGDRRGDHLGDLPGCIGCVMVTHPYSMGTCLGPPPSGSWWGRWGPLVAPRACFLLFCRPLHSARISTAVAPRDPEEEKEKD
ncbi:uncharacterized protein zgc:101569 isoform X2 [Syngnathoides biaculeatus]|uniref:uncharacterized protein zgc:101569 isoform X2 n=1 Tax=Syngnathoides biaculeatus TaxID=300417 RepID=UPI002ADDD1F8|nr:uncharacterized protein zgc:101569 isoform X2 [Syngnathoides biaculeatus]